MRDLLRREANVPCIAVAGEKGDGNGNSGRRGPFLSTGPCSLSWQQAGSAAGSQRLEVSGGFCTASNLHAFCPLGECSYVKHLGSSLTEAIQGSPSSS